MTGRDDFFRFRRGMIYIINVSLRVGLSKSVIDGGPNAVDDEFVQDLFLPGNANCGGEAELFPLHSNGASPLLGKKRAEAEV